MFVCLFVCVVIREQSEIKQSVSKLTEEVSSDLMLLLHDDACLHISQKAVITSLLSFRLHVVS